MNFHTGFHSWWVLCADVENYLLVPFWVCFFLMCFFKSWLDVKWISTLASTVGECFVQMSRTRTSGCLQETWLARASDEMWEIFQLLTRKWFACYSWKMLQILFTENLNEITRGIGVIGCISFARRGAPIKVWLYLWLIEMPNQFPCRLFTPCNFVRTLIFSKHRKLQLRFQH